MRTKQQAQKMVIDLFEQKGLKWDTKDLIDWNLTGNESDEDLEQMVHDVCSKIHTDLCENKNAWMYEN